jgi:hypothetical protein
LPWLQQTQQGTGAQGRAGCRAHSRHLSGGGDYDSGTQDEPGTLCFCACSHVNLEAECCHQRLGVSAMLPAAMRCCRTQFTGLQQHSATQVTALSV